jgi:uncharacterized protein (DUF2267 family)
MVGPVVLMKTHFNDFVGEVQHRIEAGTQDEAVRTTRAVLETLSERIQEGDAADIAGTLPMEIDWYLLHPEEHAQRFGFDEFVDRVDERMHYEHLDLESGYSPHADLDRSEVVYRAQAVVELLDETLPAEGVDALRDHLPEEYEPLFEFVDIEAQPWEQTE